MEADLDILSSQLKQGLDLKVDNVIDSKYYQKQTLLKCGYRLGDQIGAGPFSQVYKAYDRQDMPVVIKIINKRQHRENALKGVPENQTQQVIEYYNQMIQNCLQLMMTIDSENVLKMINFFDDDQNQYYITEYCEEEASQYYVRGTNYYGFKEQTAVKQLIQVLNGLKDINDAQFVDRDIKSQNILKQGNTLKICDFGFSKPISRQQKFTTLLGTSEYEAQEIIQENKNNHKQKPLDANFKKLKDSFPKLTKDIEYFQEQIENYQNQLAFLINEVKNFNLEEIQIIAYLNQKVIESLIQLLDKLLKIEKQNKI